MDEQVSFRHLFERGAKGCHQCGGQSLQETDRIGQQDFLPTRQLDAPRHRVERGEEPVFGQAVDVRQPVEQGRLARVGVADERDDGRAYILAAVAVQLALRSYLLQFLLKLRFLTTQQTAVNLDLLLPFAALLYAAFLS